MKGRMNTELGSILIDTDVIATYAGSVAVECFGIVGMATVNMKDGFVRLLKKDSLKHGIKVSHSHRRSNKMWKSNVKSVRVKENGVAKKMYVCTSCLKSGKVERA